MTLTTLLADIDALLLRWDARAAMARALSRPGANRHGDIATATEECAAELRAVRDKAYAVFDEPEPEKERLTA